MRCAAGDGWGPGVRLAGMAARAGSRKRTRPAGDREKVVRLLRLSLTATALLCLAAIAFLLPMVVDPALAALLADLQPATCTVLSSRSVVLLPLLHLLWCCRLVVGRSRCSWASCRQACTQTAATCTQVTDSNLDDGGINVWWFLLVWSEASDVNVCWQVKVSLPPAPAPAVLLVNMRACGRDCAAWLERLPPGTSLPCHYSTANLSQAVAEHRPERDRQPPKHR